MSYEYKYLKYRTKYYNLLGQFGGFPQCSNGEECKILEKFREQKANPDLLTLKILYHIKNRHDVLNPLQANEAKNIAKTIPRPKCETCGKYKSMSIEGDSSCRYCYYGNTRIIFDK